MERITDKMLNIQIGRLNKTTGQPVEAVSHDKNGKLQFNIGNYHLDSAYGGVCLHQTLTEGGAVDDVFSCGYTTKRDLFNRIHAFLEGYRTAQEKK